MINVTAFAASLERRPGLSLEQCERLAPKDPCYALIRWACDYGIWSDVRVVQVTAIYIIHHTQHRGYINKLFPDARTQLTHLHNEEQDPEVFETLAHILGKSRRQELFASAIAAE